MPSSSSTSSAAAAEDGQPLILNMRSTVASRQKMHPLQVNDPEAMSWIKLVKLEYIENVVQSPVPRSQDLPEEAFGKIHGRAVVVSTSHAWYVFLQAYLRLLLPSPYIIPAPTTSSSRLVIVAM